MRLYGNGLVTNENNQVLLIRRNDLRTWAPPGGAIEAQEMPPAGAAREVEEETGIKVHPVRLVEMQFRPESPTGILIFVFRCIQRGGQIAPSAESPQVGFFPATDLPRPMLNVHRAMLANGLNHAGGRPHWNSIRLPTGVRLARQFLFGFWDLRDRMQGKEPFLPPVSWQVGAFCILRNPAGEVLWVRRGDGRVWNLPGGGPEGIEPPWETALRETKEETGLTVRLTGCPGIYVRRSRNQIRFTFTAEVTGGTLTLNPEATAFGYFAPGAEPPHALPAHVKRVADAVASTNSAAAIGQDQTLFQEELD
jgi:ADP-ribose pyrophosphatase YjhB (NUDIX family)